jgi:very-short-patch-repair endonuclease
MRDSIIDKLLSHDSKKYNTILTQEEKDCIQTFSTVTQEKTPRRTLNKQASLYVQDLDTDKQCKICSRNIHFRDFTSYISQQYCSNTCKHKDIETVNSNARLSLKGNKKAVEKRKKTLIERYNQDNPMKVESIKEQRKVNSLDKYGVEHPSLHSDIKQKRQSTCLERYGHTNYLSYLSTTNNSKLLNKYQDLLTLSKITPLFTQEQYQGIIQHNKTVIYEFECKECKKKIHKHIASWSQEDTCPYCDKTQNTYEECIENFLIKHKIEYKKHDRTILEGKEIDFILPQYKIGIEIDGLYYHSTKFIQNTNYHLTKTQMCREKGYRLIHIFGDELSNTKALFTRLKSILKLNKIKIHARKCSVEIISNKLKKAFLNKYHLQGDCIGGSVLLGLFYKKRLVGCMVFGEKRLSLGDTSDGYELYRYCCMDNITIQGGADKLYKHFLRNYNPDSVISYCDLRYSTQEDNFYTKLGMTYSHTTKPNYWIVVGNHRYHRFAYRKSVLHRKLSVFDDTLTEKENLHRNNIYMIYDCGSCLYKYSK